MPEYQYKCNHCGYVFDVDKKVNEYNRDEWCPRCDKDCRIQIQLIPFHLKGSGWAHQDPMHTDLEGRDGYDVLQSEVDRNGEDALRADDRVAEGMEHTGE